MQTLENLRRKIDNAGDLQDVVRIMKAASASSIQLLEQAVESLEGYSETVHLGFQMLLSARETPYWEETASTEESGIVVFGSQQGMCGRFNQVLADFTEKRIPELNAENVRIIAMGYRIHGLLENRGMIIEQKLAMPDSAEAIPRTVDILLSRIQEWRFQTPVDQLFLFYNAKMRGSRYEPVGNRVLPLDVQWLKELQDTVPSFRTLPEIPLPWTQLLASLVRQYIYITLFRAAGESLASENAARLASMQAAEQNIGEHLEGLVSRYNRSRQNQVTSELLDIVSGFEALST